MGFNMTQALAGFVADLRFEDIPEHVVVTQKKSVLDALGISYGASGLGDGCREFVEIAAISAAGGREEAGVIGFPLRLPAVWAAFANASMAHSLDFGDTQMHAVIHSNASTFPAALAAAEAIGNVSGKDFITALVAGSEVACRIALGVSDTLDGNGFYMPPIYTSFGATAAVCKLLGLSRDQIVNALGFNLCQTTCSGEVMNDPTSVVRSVREAFAAKNAVLSAYIAKTGAKAFDEPLQGKKGFYHAYAGRQGDEVEAMKGLGTYFESGDLYFKQWPSCAGTHTYIRHAKELVRENGIRPADIESVRVTTSTLTEMLASPIELRCRPDNAITAKFSIPYTSALAMLYGNVELSDFTMERIRAEEILELSGKFTYEMEKSWDNKAASSNARMIITLKNGEKFIGESMDGIGSKQPAWEEMMIKFTSCAMCALNPKTAEQLEAIATLTKHLDELDCISDWAQKL